MAETPEERLARLRREIEGETPGPPSTPAAPRLPPAPTRESGHASTAARPADATPPGDTIAAARQTWDAIVGGAPVRTWLGVGLLVLGAYLVLVRFVPGLSLVGSAVILVAGLIVLAMHFRGRLGGWALYAGAVLAAVGGARLVDAVIPLLPTRGLTAIAVGIAFLAIASLRRSEGRGYGWQAALGAAALALGVVELLLGLLPGSPGLLDLAFPVAVLAVGVFLISRSMRRSA